MSEFFASCTPNSYPHEDGRVEHGYQLNVQNEKLEFVATVNLLDWERFDQEAAERHLAEAGFVLQPEPGWSPAGLGHMAPVVRAGAVDPVAAP